jgi:hypothetical protein
LSNRTLVELADLLRHQRRRYRSRWRRLEPGRQALLVLAHLRNSDTYARLAAGFAVAASTAWRYVREAVHLLAARAENVTTAGLQAARVDRPEPRGPRQIRLEDPRYLRPRRPSWQR